MYGVVLDDEVDFDAAEFASRLARLGVQTRPFFVGMHEQPVFQAKGLFVGECYPVTERISARGLYLPSGQAITDGQIQEVISAVRQVLEA
jgi:perosamine synthetase